MRVAALRRGWLRADIGRTLHKIVRCYEKPQSSGNRYLQPGSSAERHRAPAAGGCGPPAGAEPYIRNRRVNYTSVGDRRLFFLRPLMPRARFSGCLMPTGYLLSWAGKKASKEPAGNVRFPPDRRTSDPNTVPWRTLKPFESCFPSFDEQPAPPGRPNPAPSRHNKQPGRNL